MAVRASSSDIQAPPPVTVPKVVTDPIWSLRIWPVTFTVAGQDFTIPEVSAAGWLESLMSGDFDLMVMVEDLLPPQDMERLRDLLWAGALNLMELDDLLSEVLNAVTGRPWYVALRVISVVQTHWDFLGADLALRGVRADTISIAAWLDVALLTILNNIDPEKATMFTSQLEMPPPGATVKPETMEITASQFMSMA